MPEPVRFDAVPFVTMKSPAASPVTAWLNCACTVNAPASIAEAALSVTEGATTAWLPTTCTLSKVAVESVDEDADVTARPTYTVLDSPVSVAVLTSVHALPFAEA